MTPTIYEQHQNRCFKKWAKGDFFIDKIAMKNVFNWSNSCITFFSPIEILTGKNGAGKSTCVNALKFAFYKQEGKKECGIISSIRDFQIIIANRRGHEIIIEDGEITKQEFKIPIIIDMTFDTSLYSFFKNSSNQERSDYVEILQQYDAELLPPNLLKILEFFIEKKIVTAERIIDLGLVEDDDIDQSEISKVEENGGRKKEYYQITLENGVVYDSYTMGSGEFFINQFLWGLYDLPPNSIVIIEELENYLHSGVQKKIIELIYELSHKRYIQFILTTHSPTIIDHVWDDSRILVQYEKSNVRLISNCPNWLAKDDLGTTVQNKKIALVEDDKASSFLRIIISFHCPSLINYIEIVNCKGDTQIERLMNSVNDVKLTNFIGVLDGDCIDTSRIGIPHVLKLPGNDIPEKIMVDITRKNPKLLSDMIIVNEDMIIQALDVAVTNPNHHEWIGKFSHDLGQSPDVVWESMVKIWCLKNKTEAKTFFKSFYREFLYN
jgi:AAA15 family ATPase/GTPase